jgi:hypothetical protein
VDPTAVAVSLESKLDEELPAVDLEVPSSGEPGMDLIEEAEDAGWVLGIEEAGPEVSMPWLTLSLEVESMVAG